MANKKRKPRPGNRLDRDSIAAALALAQTVGDREAAKSFNVSVRSLHRYRAAYRAAMATDPTSDLAVAVSQARQRALRQVDDLLTSTWRAILTHLAELLPRADFDQTLKAVETVGSMRLTRQALGVEEDNGEAMVEASAKQPEPDGERLQPHRESQTAAESEAGDAPEAAAPTGGELRSIRISEFQVH